MSTLTVNNLSVCAVLEQGSWMVISAALNVQGIMELLSLANVIDHIELAGGTKDQFLWRWMASGQ